MIDATALPPSPLHEELSIEITRAGAAKVIGSMLMTGNTQPAGLLHGGTTAVLVEGLTSLTARLHVQPERVTVGIDPNLIRLYPVASGKITGRAVPAHLGNGTTVRTVEMHDEEGRLTVVGRLISRLMAPRK